MIRGHDKAIKGVSFGSCLSAIFITSTDIQYVLPQQTRGIKNNDCVLAKDDFFSQ